jgi:hypothetical protein
MRIRRRDSTDARCEFLLVLHSMHDVDDVMSRRARAAARAQLGIFLSWLSREHVITPRRAGESFSPFPNVYTGHRNTCTRYVKPPWRRLLPPWRKSSGSP